MTDTLDKFVNGWDNRDFHGTLEVPTIRDWKAISQQMRWIEQRYPEFVATLEVPTLRDWLGVEIWDQSTNTLNVLPKTVDAYDDCQHLWEDPPPVTGTLEGISHCGCDYCEHLRNKGYPKPFDGT